MTTDNCAPNCFPLLPTATLFSNHGVMLWPALVVIDTMGRKGWDAMGGVVTVSTFTCSL